MFPFQLQWQRAPARLSTHHGDSPGGYIETGPVTSDTQTTYRPLDAFTEPGLKQLMDLLSIDDRQKIAGSIGLQELPAKPGPAAVSSSPEAFLSPHVTLVDVICSQREPHEIQKWFKELKVDHPDIRALLNKEQIEYLRRKQQEKSLGSGRRRHQSCRNN